jgi:hypothetical protein
MNTELIVSSVARAILLPPLSFFILLLGMGAGAALAAIRGRGDRIHTRAAFVLCTVVGANLLVRPLESMTPPLAPSARERASHRRALRRDHQACTGVRRRRHS